MKKIISACMILVLLLSGCAAEKSNTSTSERTGQSEQASQTEVDVQNAGKESGGDSLSVDAVREPWTLTDFLENMPFVFEGTCLQTERATSGSGAVMTVRVEKVYQGELKEETVLLRSDIPSLFPVGESRLIFAEAGASVYEGLPFYIYSSTALYPVGERVNEGMIVGVDELSYGEIVDQIVQYTKEHPYDQSVHVAGAYLESEDLREIYDFADVVLTASPTAVVIDSVTDRTTYRCTVTSTVKGRVPEEVLVTAQKDGLKPGEDYVMMLSQYTEGSVALFLSSKQCIFLLDSEEARQILSFS